MAERTEGDGLAEKLRALAGEQPAKSRVAVERGDLRRAADLLEQGQEGRLREARNAIEEKANLQLRIQEGEGDSIAAHRSDAARIAYETAALIVAAPGNHSEHCTNMKDCESFPGGSGECHWPRPAALKQAQETLEGEGQDG